MLTLAHELADSRESLEVGLFGGHQRIRSEVRQHLRYQTSDVSHFELQCLVRPIRPDESASPFILDHVEQFSSVCVLADRETRPNLPPEAMTIAWLKRNAKTAFAVYETRDVGIQIHRQRSGPACYGIFRSHPRALKPLSRYGDSNRLES